jgi:hypothetical protein
MSNKNLVYFVYLLLSKNKTGLRQFKGWTGYFLDWACKTIVLQGFSGLLKPAGISDGLLLHLYYLQ